MKLNRTIIAIIAVVALIGLAVTVGIIAWLVFNYQMVWDWLQSSNNPERVIQCSEVLACKIAHPIVYGLIYYLFIRNGGRNGIY